jgi:hypothetical protein
MDLLWSLGLIVVLLLALNHMAGGRASSVLRPVTGIVTQLISNDCSRPDATGWIGLAVRDWLTHKQLPKIGGNTKDDKRGRTPRAALERVALRMQRAEEALTRH